MDAVARRKREPGNGEIHNITKINGTNLPHCLKIHKLPIDKRSGSGYDGSIRKYGNAM